MARIFADFCLKAFPSEQAVDALAKQRNLQAMTPKEVAIYLHADPGRGWAFRTALAGYVVTIEHPPIRACAVRRMTGSGFTTATPFLRAINEHATTNGLQLANIPQHRSQTTGGADILIIPLAAVPVGQKAPTEILMYISTNYHGRYGAPSSQPANMASDITSGVGVEIRFVRQLQGQK